MYSYKGIKCPVCNVNLSENDDVVVCPVCGAPHHRECYKSLGHCKFEETHGTDQQWTRPEPEPKAADEKNNNNAAEQNNVGSDNNSNNSNNNNGNNNNANGVTECPRCKTQNDSSMNFCIKCGYPLNPNMNSNTYTPNGQRYGQQFNQPNITVMFDPYGGVDPKSEIDGVPVADIAAFVGQNSSYYIPKFKEMSTNKHKNYLNFSAFFFGYSWFAFRKMPFYSVLIGILNLVLSTFYTIASITPEMALILQQSYGMQINGYTFPTYVPYVLFFLLLAMRLVLLIFGNKIYMKYVINKVKKYSEKYQSIDELQYQKALNSHGGISLFMYAIAFALNYLISTSIIALFIM